MTKNRPVFLDLTRYRFPIGAIMSVGHRASGVLMIMLIPVLVYLLDLSLTDEEGFAAAYELTSGLLARLIIFVIIWALIHHLLAGIRFLLMDIHIGVSRETSRRTAFLVMLAAPLLAIVVEVLI